MIKQRIAIVRITGTYTKTSVVGETVSAFVPVPLPPRDPALDLGSYEVQNVAAENALARLAAVAGLVPSVDWLLYGAIRREALLTSQIEGTQATLTDLFDEEAGLAVDNIDDVEEVTNYLRAWKRVRDNLRSPKGLPLSVRLLCDAHRLLLDGARGAGKQPGEIRRSQNWIGGTRPGNAVFVPPPADRVPKLLSALEQFIHAKPTPKNALPPLVKIALVHAHFETIHPFLDGNGRIGRLLISALLEEWQLLPEPLLYLSAFLKQHQFEYYRLLDGIRARGEWEAWVSFFLEAVTVSASNAEANIIKIASLIANDRRRLLADASAGSYAYRLFELLPTMPRFTVERVRAALDTSFPTANLAVKQLEAVGIVIETSGQRKNRSFGYAKYIELLSE